MLYILVMLVVAIAALVLVLSKRLPAGFVFSLAAVSAVVFTVAASTVVIGNQKVGVESRFGRTIESSYAPGIHFAVPWASIHRYDALRREYAFKGEVITADNNPVTMTVGLATTLNRDVAWKVQKAIGSDYYASLVVPAAQTAVRDGISAFPWTKAVTSDRGEVQLAIQKNFERILVEQFVANGLTEIEAKAALVISPVQLRSALPDAKVLNAVAERSAADQDLQRQKTLTQIAAEEALRRKNEGDGVANLFSQLPKGFTSGEIAEVLSALATKTRADAMLKAVESNQVTGIIMNGDTAAGVAASFPSKATEANAGTEEENKK